MKLSVMFRHYTTIRSATFLKFFVSLISDNFVNMPAWEKQRKALSAMLLLQAINTVYIFYFKDNMLSNCFAIIKYTS